jgi:hypothetical protein
MKKILGNILPYVLTESKQQSHLTCSMVAPQLGIGLISLPNLLTGGIIHMEATGSSILKSVTRGSIQYGAMALKNRVAGIADLLTI